MDIEKKVDALAVQDKQDERLRALIHVAELQQNNLDRLDEELASLADSVSKMHEGQQATDKRVEVLLDSGRASDERVNALVSAVGELIRCGSQPPA